MEGWRIRRIFKTKEIIQRIDQIREFTNAEEQAI
jgi:hypothetical protein